MRRRPLYRRASLTFLKPLQEADENEDEDDSTDLKHLEELCARTTARCNAHEQLIAHLEHDIEQRISRWDTITALLRDIEEKAHNLTEQIQSSLLTLRTTTAGQILTSKEAVVKADDKVGQSRRSLSEAERTIREAKKTILVLETRLVEEEATLDKIDMYTQLMLWSSLAFVLLFSIFLAWWLNRDGVI